MAGVVKPVPLPAPAKVTGLLGSLGLLGSVNLQVLGQVVKTYVTSKPVYDALRGFLETLKVQAPSYSSGLLELLIPQAVSAAEEALAQTAFAKN